jgi:hypothetical protein
MSVTILREGKAGLRKNVYGWILLLQVMSVMRLLLKSVLRLQ